ncbi:MAG: cysteine desulfurase-like protein [Gammaproteobacteria bacterium]|nr:MAG: cysteine desulfurase-like protein [Gammaproteobacteria bacterium]
MPYSDAQCLRAREDFPALSRSLGGQPLVFLDGPAGTQVPGQVIEAQNHAYRMFNTNTGGEFVTSRDLDEALWRTRETVATFVGASEPASISFGANMTTLAFSLSDAFSRLWGEGDEVVISALDHEANRGPWLQLQDRGVTIREIAIDRQGYFDPDDMRSKINERTRLVAVNAASNALGTVNDLSLARELSREVGAWMLVDAVHYAPHIALDVQAMDPDFLLCSAYKFYGPHVGILYTRPGLLNFLPTNRLCTQNSAAPYRIETGTLNHAAIVSIAAAIEYIAGWGEGNGLREQLVDAMGKIYDYEHELAAHYYQHVAAVPGVKIWGPDFSATPRSPTVSITSGKISTDDAVRDLGAQGFCLWQGHFYAQRVVELLGLSENGGLIRMGVSMYNTRSEMDRLLAAIERLPA